MGRPLNKKYFGPPSAGGEELKVQFHNGTGSVNGWIVKQTGSKRFICSDGSVEVECYLVPKNSGDLAANEMSLSVKDDSGNVYQVSKISAHRVTVETGSTTAWNFNDSTTDGYAEMEEAGDDSAFTNADDFEADTAVTNTITVLAFDVDSTDLNGNYVTLTEGDGTVHYFWFNVNSGATDPAVAGATGHEVAAVSYADEDAAATALQGVITAVDGFTATVTDNVITVTNDTTGSVDGGTVVGDYVTITTAFV